jgi:hypothetical protein
LKQKSQVASSRSKLLEQSYQPGETSLLKALVRKSIMLPSCLAPEIQDLSFVQIRGQNLTIGSTQPLYVVDAGLVSSDELEVALMV